MRFCFAWALVLFPAVVWGGQPAPQIGGGVCSASTLNGNYALSLNMAKSTTQVSPGAGIANFDGVSTATFTLAGSGGGEILSGTYTLNSYCTGTIALISGSFANLSMVAYAGGGGFALTGQDGTYLYSGSGMTAPGTCNAAMLTGTYGFSGPAYTGFPGAVSGVIQFDGRNSASFTWYVASASGITKTTASGSYLVMPSCTGSAAVVDGAGISYMVNVALGSENAFVLSVATPTLEFGGVAQAVQTPQGCTQATLSGLRSLQLDGLSGASVTATHSIGTASFDGVSRVTLVLAGSSTVYLGNYSIGSNCAGTLNISVGGSSNYTLIAYNNGRSFTVTGEDGTYVYTGSGGTPPASCITASLSGSYAFTGAGVTIGNPAGISGLLTFDGRGGVLGEWSSGSFLAASADTASGQYSINSSCQGAATMLDPNGVAYVANFVMTAADASGLSVDLSSSSGVFSGSGFVSFTPPGMAVVNGASYAAGATPAGSEFVLFGSNLTFGGSSQAGKPPLPKNLLNMSVTVNGETAPLYYVSGGQVNAQMPVDVQPGLATVTVTSGSAQSNSAAVPVPAAAPGIYFYSLNRGVFQNPNYSLNSTSSPAHPGDVVVAWFTGGGPVNAAGELVSGAGSPNGLSPLTETSAITVGGVPAVIDYIGLAPGIVGVYQANFVVPQVSAGNQSVVISVGGANSPAELITIAQ